MTFSTSSKIHSFAGDTFISSSFFIGILKFLLSPNILNFLVLNHGQGCHQPDQGHQGIQGKSRNLFPFKENKHILKNQGKSGKF